MQKSSSPKAQDAQTSRDRKFRESLYADVERIGMSKVWPVSTAPEGWVKCNGAAIGRLVYPELFALIGVTYGVGDGTTTFNVPDWAAAAPSGGIYIMKV